MRQFYLCFVFSQLESLKEHDAPARHPRYVQLEALAPARQLEAGEVVSAEVHPDLQLPDGAVPHRVRGGLLQYRGVELKESNSVLWNKEMFYDHLSVLH